MPQPNNQKPPSNYLLILLSGLPVLVISLLLMLRGNLADQLNIPLTISRGHFPAIIVFPLSLGLCIYALLKIIKEKKERNGAGKIK